MALTEWSVFVAANPDKALQMEPMFLVAKGNADDNFYLVECDPATGVLLTSSGGGGGGSGDVNGPASSVTDQLVLFNGITGKAIKAATLSGRPLLTSGVLSVSAINLATEVTGTLPAANVQYLTTVTSDVQTQLNGKQASGSYVTTARTLSTSAPLSGGGDLSADRSLSITQADGSTDGYLSSTDWNTFNNKQPAGSYPTTARAINTTAPITGGGDLSADRTLAMAASTNSVDGYLTAADHTTFAAKVSPSRTIATTSPITGGGDLSADRTIAIPEADGSTDGYLSSTDWNYFDSKQPAGSYALEATEIQTSAPLTGGGDLSATRTLSIPAADTTTDGYLTSTDWNTFNGKQPAGSYVTTARTINTTAPITGGGDLTADRTLAMAAADTTTDGYLTSTDWNTFNDKASATGTADRLAIYDSAGDLTSIAQLQTNPTHKTLQFNHDINFVDSEAGQDHIITVNERPTANAPATTRTAFAISQNIDTANGGFDFGTGGQAAKVLALYVNHQGLSDTGGIAMIDNNFNLGNGTDPITVKGIAYAYGFGSVNANVTVDGPLQGYGFQPNVNASAAMTNNCYVNAFYDFANILCPLQSSYTSANFSPTIASAANNTGITGINIAPTVTAFVGNAGFNGIGISGTFGTMNVNSNWSGLNVNPTIANARFAAGVNVTMDNVTPYAGVQSSLVFQDLTFTWILPADNNSYTLEYTGGGTAGSEVVTISGNSITCQIESGVSTANQIKTAFEANSGFNSSITITVSGTGTNTQVTAGPTNFVNGENVGQVYAAYLDGKVAITGALEFNGDFQCAKFDAFRQYNLTDGGGQPSSGHSLITMPTVAANATIANADTLGVNTAALINIGDNATVTTAFLGLSALGLPAVATLGAGATVDRMSGAVFALSLDASAGGGTIDTVALCRSLAIPNGVTTVNRLYGYEFDVPFGSVGTAEWGVYIKPAVNNWMAGSLKIGGTAVSDDTVTNSSVDLEVTDGAVLFANLTNAEISALTPVNGMQVYSGDDNEMKAYQNGAWGPLGGNTALAAETIVTISSNVTLTDKAIHLVDTTAARTLTLPDPATTKYIVVKDKSGLGSVNNITIARFGTEEIEGVAASFVMEGDRQQAIFVTDGTNWYEIS